MYAYLINSLLLPFVRYDYSSSHVGAGVGEQITVTANMRRFCTTCTIYLAVYGYPGRYLTNLQQLPIQYRRYILTSCICMFLTRV